MRRKFVTVFETLAFGTRSLLPDPSLASKLRCVLLPLVFLLLAGGCAQGFRDPLVSESDTPLELDLEGHWLGAGGDEPILTLIREIGPSRYRATSLGDEVRTWEFTLARVGEDFYLSNGTRRYLVFDSSTGTVTNWRGTDFDFFVIVRLQKSARPDEWHLFPLLWNAIDEDLRAGKLAKSDKSDCEWDISSIQLGVPKPEKIIKLNYLCIIEFDSPDAQRRYFEENRERLFRDEDKIVFRKITG